MTPRKTLRIARWEVARSASELDRRTVAALVVVALALAAVGPALVQGGTAPDRGIYRVAVDGESRYYDPVADASSLRVVDPRADAVRQGAADVAITDGEVTVADSQRGRAALAALRDAVAAYNDRLMARESDRAAAFPVEVTLRYREQAAAGGPGDRTDGPAGDTDGSGGTDGTGNGDGSPDDGSGTDGSGSDLGSAIRSAGGFLGGTQTGSPAAISPPFPLRSLLLAFVFVLPLNVVVQAYGSSVMTERIDRRGEPLLVAPVTRADIVAGKTLPYVAGSVAITAALAAAMGGGPLTVAAVVPVVLLFLAATFVGAMFARSFKELTFVTVTVSVLGTAYVFVPAIFTDVHPIAAISPLTVVVSDLAGAGVEPGTFAFATLPMTVVAVTLFGLGTGVYREEDMFTQRPPGAKALDAVAAHLSPRRVPVWGALAVPFAFVAELFAIAALFVLPAALSLPVLLAAVAVIEETVKGVVVYAGFARDRLPDGRRGAVVAGALAGFGFAVGEKVTLAAQVVGLPDLELGRAAFAPAAAANPLLLAGLLVAPFALHAGTVALSALGARRSPAAFGVALTGAAAVHLAYNFAVVSAVA